MGFWDNDFKENSQEKDAIVRSLGLAPGWALSFITDEKPIPETWRDRFYNELVSENAAYKQTLEEAVRQHGVRWSNG